MINEPSQTTELKGGLDHVSAGVDRVRDDLTVLKDDVSDTAREGAAVVRQTATRAARKVRDAGSDAIDASANYVQRNPFSSVGLALGVGVLIGLCVSRRGD